MALLKRCRGLGATPVKSRDFDGGLAHKMPTIVNDADHAADWALGHKMRVRIV
jgi:hypothetical protein